MFFEMGLYICLEILIKKDCIGNRLSETSCAHVEPPETCPNVQWLIHFSRCRHTVDGRNSANPTWDVKNPVNNGINYQPQLVQDFVLI